MNEGIEPALERLAGAAGDSEPTNDGDSSKDCREKGYGLPCLGKVMARFKLCVKKKVIAYTLK